ncbi:MAG: T9SS type A sorting domain-containing protein [Bacteroidetes bacterium]|nr:T9SS type A sorting domain-containing protein [Bacteroidota bacterium]
MRYCLFVYRAGLILLLLNPWSAGAQFTYRLDNSIPVYQDNRSFGLPWSGGFNSPQINTMDLNADGTDDLVVFEKTAARISTFLAVNGAYQYNPDYESYFPTELNTFVLLRDYDCDGRKDLFTFGDIGIYVFRNITQPGKPPAWKKLLSYNSDTGMKSEVILTRGFSSKINLLPGTNDLPNITDMDGDGDLDILNMRFISPSTAEYHRNFSKERYGTCDSLDFERQTQKWGNFEECSCGKIAFAGQTCAQIGGRTQATQHTGGKFLLTYDFDNDGDQDVLYSEEQCPNIYYMENIGTADNANLNNLSLYPPGSPVALNLFPAGYMEDVDFDGKKDLLVAPNLANRSQLANNFTQSLWLYRNTGSNKVPAFSFVKTDFLQDQMIEVGDNASPALLDIDNDGDQDLFIGTYGGAGMRGTITFFRNAGTNALPSFQWETDDYLSVSIYSFYNVKIQFKDVDSNGGTDLVVVATSLTNGRNGLYYMPSSSSSGPSFGGQGLKPITFSVDPNETVHMNDVDLDGKVDILKGTYKGSVEFWRNTPAGYTLADAAYLGIGESIDRQNPALTVADFNADGLDDLLMGDQGGRLTLYSNFRGGTSAGITQLIYNDLSQTYNQHNLGGVLQPAAAHLFGTDKPDILVGTGSGGVQVLRNEEGKPVSDQPQFILFPNPVARGQAISIISDRPGTVEIFTLLGQHIGSSMIIPSNTATTYPLQGISPGMYIARFTAGGASVNRQFVIP